MVFSVFSEFCNHHYSLILNFCQYPQNKPIPTSSPLSSLPTPNSSVPGYLFCVISGLFWIASFLYFLNWGIVDLQCCVTFRCAVQWFSYIYIYSFLIFFSPIGYYKILSIVLCAIQQVLVDYVLYTIISIC